MQKNLDEIKKSLTSYVKNFGIEGTEDEIKEHHKGELRETMLFLLYDKYNFGTKGKTHG